jgi:hypothetical protein
VRVAKVKDRLTVNKQKAHRCHTERFSFKKFNKIEDKEQYSVEISNTFTALDKLNAEATINRVWETIRENIKISAKESIGY